MGRATLARLGWGLLVGVSPFAITQASPTTGPASRALVADAPSALDRPGLRTLRLKLAAGCRDGSRRASCLTMFSCVHRVRYRSAMPDADLRPRSAIDLAELRRVTEQTSALGMKVLQHDRRTAASAPPPKK